jgi:hypothetical protein
MAWQLSGQLIEACSCKDNATWEAEALEHEPR